jgi:hypothetical protein
LPLRTVVGGEVIAHMAWVPDSCVQPHGCLCESGFWSWVRCCWLAADPAAPHPGLLKRRRHQVLHVLCHILPQVHLVW